MATCASCGRPLDAAPVHGACPSCTWRAALRVSKATVAGEAPAESVAQTVPLSDDADDVFIEAGDDPTTLMERLYDFAATAGETLADERARRVHAALLRGNLRPYRSELNRLTGRFIDRLEDAWDA